MTVCIMFLILLIKQKIKIKNLLKFFCGNKSLCVSKAFNDTATNLCEIDKEHANKKHSIYSNET